MHRIIGKFTLAIVAAAMLFGFGTVGEVRAEKKRICVLLWTDESRFVDGKNAFVDQLRKEGFGDDAVALTIENCGGNKAKAADLTKKIAAAKYDLVVPVGTSAAVAVAKDIKDVPIVFMVVYDPVASKIADGWESSGNNTTGATAFVKMSILVDTLKKLAPVKKLAVLYTPGEKNSELQLKDLQSAQAAGGFKVVPVPLATKEDVAAMMAQATGAADAMFLSGSSVVGAATPAIVEAAIKAKVITVSHLDDPVEKGALLGVTASPAQQGQLAGVKAAKVLKGAAPSSLPIDQLKTLDIILNMKTAKAIGLTVPADFQKAAARIIQ
jgi:putative ABC transport system substrate-binding protein